MLLFLVYFSILFFETGSLTENWNLQLISAGWPLRLRGRGLPPSPFSAVEL